MCVALRRGGCLRRLTDFVLLLSLRAQLPFGSDLIITVTVQVPDGEHAIPAGPSTALAHVLSLDPKPKGRGRTARMLFLSAMCVCATSLRQLHISWRAFAQDKKTGATVPPVLRRRRRDVPDDKSTGQLFFLKKAASIIRAHVGSVNVIFSHGFFRALSEDGWNFV